MTLDPSDSPVRPSSPTRRDTRQSPDFAHEEALLAGGARCIAGIDEAGRGPLAGPVVAAAVILDPSAIPQGLDDSKALGASQRERLFVAILDTATISVASASARDIDRINIRQATLLAMRRAVAGLPERPAHALVDGRDVPPGLACAATALVAGDARCLSIAAASIVAKVMRDRMMARLSEVYPLYGFERHMGYGTKEHLAAIAAHGPSPIHRLSFNPLRQRLLDLASGG